MEEMVQETIVVEKQPAMTEESLGYLKSSAGWAQFLAIMNFISCGFIILCGVMLLVLAFIFPTIMPYMDGMSNLTFTGAFLFIAILYLALGVIGLMLAYYLFKFSADAKTAVLQLNTEFLTSSMLAMKKYFKLSGILTIVAIVMVCLWIPIAVILQLGNM